MAASHPCSALCQAGTCTATNVAQLEECLKDDGCVLRTKDCCQCGGIVSDPNAIIALGVGFDSQYANLVCTGGPFQCEACAAPQFPAAARARCDLSAGHCYVEWSN